jgi:hypothetical protein
VNYFLYRPTAEPSPAARALFDLVLAGAEVPDVHE